MELHTLPIEGQYIVYRPLLQLAFVGNKAMADLAQRLARQEITPDQAPPDAATFLRSIGFLEPDPPAPPPPQASERPTTAVLLMTNRCNLRCTYCYASGGEGAARDISLSTAQALIDCAYANAAGQGSQGFELCFHGGGEPVQAWGVMEQATAYARSKSLPCNITIVSNGVWTAAQREWLLKNMNGVSISFDGREQTQDRQRPFASGRGSAKAVLRTLAALDQAGFSYGIRLTATAPWGEQLAEDVRFICQHTKCPAMQVEPAFNTQRGEHRGATEPESQAFVEGFLAAFEIASEAGRQLVYSGARPWLLTQSFCTAPYGALVANPGDKLVACYEVAGDGHPMLELSVRGCVEGSQVKVDVAARDALLAHLDAKRATCRDCFCYWHCAGDCYVRSPFSGDGVAGDGQQRCSINREITARLLLWYIMKGDGVWRGQGVPAQEQQLLKGF